MIKIDTTKKDNETRALKGAVDMMNIGLDQESDGLFRIGLLNYLQCFDIHTQERIAEYMNTTAEDLEAVISEHELFEEMQSVELIELLDYIGLEIQREPRTKAVKFYLED